MQKNKKLKLGLEILLCMILSIVIPQLIILINPESLLLAAFSYAAIAIIIILYIKLCGQNPMEYLMLQRSGISDIFIGIILGIFMAAVQQIPLLAIGFDYSMLASLPDWKNMIIMSIFCLVFVGGAEEILMRGFLLRKSQELIGSKAAAIIINCLLFYVYHWPPIPFVFGQFFNVSLNTIILSVFLYKSKRKSLLPLIIAHGVYDIIISFILPILAFYLT